MHRSMPLNALDNVDVDYKVPAAEMGALLARLTKEEAAPEPLIAAEERERMEAEVQIARERDMVRFRCHMRDTRSLPARCHARARRDHHGC